MVLEFGEDIRRCSFGQLKQYLHVQLFATLWIIDRQAPLSMGFSRQEYWSGLPFSSPEDLPDPGIKPESLRFPALAGGFFTTSPPVKPSTYLYHGTIARSPNNLTESEGQESSNTAIQPSARIPAGFSVTCAYAA